MNCFTCSSGSIADGGSLHSIKVRDVTHYFDFSERFGPLFYGKSGRVKESPTRGRVYLAVSLWYAQGRHVDSGGLCIWEAEADLLEGAVHIAGNTWATPSVARGITKATEPTDAD